MGSFIILSVLHWSQLWKKKGFEICTAAIYAETLEGIKMESRSESFVYKCKYKNYLRVLIMEFTINDVT